MNERYINGKNAVIKLGDVDGVDVQSDIENGRYLITTTNSYDVYWEFARKDKNNNFYAQRLENEDRSIAVFAVPLDNLGSEQAKKDLSYKIATARKTTVEIDKEKEDLMFTVAFDHANGKKPEFIFKNPASKYTTGEVLKAGKYFVAITAGENDTSKYFRVINTGRLLEGREFADRENSIKEKMVVGSKKYIKFADNGRIQVNDYVAKQEAIQQPGQEPPGQLTRPQREAVMAIREANVKAWKRDLATMWETGNYKGLKPEQAALLQQVRNQHGPEWLSKVSSKELYGINDKPTPVLSM